MKKEILIGLLIALTIGVFLSPFASSFPDGLEKTAEDLHFLNKGEGKEVITSPIPDYAIPGISNEGLATAGAGLVGTLIVFGAVYGLGKIVQGRKENQTKSF